MAEKLEKLEKLHERYVPPSTDNQFYRNFYAYFIIGLMLLIVTMTAAVGFLFYQVQHRPLPKFTAVELNGAKMSLTAYEEPNLQPETIIKWASKAATIAYTFAYSSYKQQLLIARPYFTEDGWNDYQASLSDFINSIVKGQLAVNSVVSGTPVISNEGPLPGKGYTWRVQVPLLVIYQAANSTSKQNFIVKITIVRVPTEINPQGIGIDQFVMTG